MNSVPYGLSKGLLLEESGELLPWFNSLHQITKKGGKPLPAKGRTSQLFWESETVFGGLRVSVQAIQRGSSGIFFLDIKHSKIFESAKDEYEYDVGLLKEKFGEPVDTGSSDGYPWVRWKWDGVTLNLGVAERFVDYVALSISKGAVE